MIVAAPLTRRLRPSSTGTAFRQLIAEAGQDVRALVASLVAGDLTPAEWSDQMLESLASAHAEAGYRGRLRAGDHAAYDRDDVRFGQLVAQEEMQYLWRFAREIEAGRYGTEEVDAAAVLRRAMLYVARLYGTANEALVLVAGDDETWIWELGAGDTCAGCVRLAQNSPYRGRPPTMPKMGQTPCLSNCLCRAFTTSGLEAFQP